MATLRKQRQVLLILASFGAIALVAVAAVFVFTQPSKKETSNEKNTTQTKVASKSSVKKDENFSSEIIWQWNGQDWAKHGKAPDCPSPLLTTLPVDLNKVTSILYPGQKRGGDYKAHGGFRFGSDNSIIVSTPLESLLVEGSRYIQDGEVQYLFTFINSCGIAFRFDHLHTLTEKFRSFVAQLPEPKVDDSRTTSFNRAIKVDQNEIVATKVGFLNSKNVFLDFGVYDLRAPNPSSKNPEFATTHENQKQFIYYGICWLEEYPKEISSKLRALPASDSVSGETSDYCI